MATTQQTKSRKCVIHYSGMFLADYIISLLRPQLRVAWCCTLALCLSLFTICPVAVAASFPSQASYEIGFSSRDKKSLDIILTAINSAQKSIRIAIYEFTNTQISEALLNAHKRGVEVHVVAERKKSRKQHSVVPSLVRHGIPVWLNSCYSHFHHKFMVIDSLHLETGSFNYSKNAVENNAENIIFLRGVPELATLYIQEWEKMREESTEFKEDKKICKRNKR